MSRFRVALRLGCPLKRAIRLCAVAALRLARPCRRANRAASSNPARCFRHWRRFAGFHYAQGVFRHAPVAAENDQEHLCLRALGQPLAALLLYGCRVPLAGKKSAALCAVRGAGSLFSARRAENAAGARRKLVRRFLVRRACSLPEAANAARGKGRVNYLPRLVRSS